MTRKKTPSMPSAKPVIYVHAKGRGPISKAAVAKLLEAGLPVCSHLAYEGFTKTEYGYDQPGLLIAELARLYPGRPVIMQRAGLAPSRQLIDQLIDLSGQAGRPVALTVLSNADGAVNPFAGLTAPSPMPEYDLAQLINLMAPGQLHALTAWADHFVLLSADLVAHLSGNVSDATMMQQLATAGASLKLADHLFLHDPENRVVRPLELESHETPYPPPFSELSARLQEWFDAGIEHLPRAPDNAAAASLHITHSWGGGVARWLTSFIDTDHTQQHFQLRSEGPQSGRGYGQKISLYANNELRCPIASWWLTPVIDSITDSHAGYQQILSEICQRYGIGRVLISSLVGHSLDALRSGLPTLQILHDHFPVWPLLSINPQPYLQSAGMPDLARALKEHVNEQEFPDKDAHGWAQIRTAYLAALRKFEIKLAAPGQSVLDLQTRLEPDFKKLAVEIIPHGFPVMEELQAILPKPRKDGRLRLVILGRMQTGKGQLLLSEALHELARHVQVYLVGTGKSGEAFFGIAGVDVIMEYERDELASILARIGPDFAALLSVVPETFSFTLSELQQMHIPVIATRTGSFPSRIEHAKTGWLIDLDSQALVNQVAALCDAPQEIEAVRANLPNIKANTLEGMLAAYNKLCPLKDTVPAFVPVEASISETQRAASDYQHTMTNNELQDALKQLSFLKVEVEKRTEWALDTGRQLKQEQRRREEWVARLQEMLADTQSDLQLVESRQRLLESEYHQLETNHLQLESDHQSLQVHRQQLETSIQHYASHNQYLETSIQQYQERTAQLEADYQRLDSDFQHLDSNYQHLDASFQHLSGQYAAILGSASWKITRPLRAARRLAQNLMLVRAWNPLRWPLLLSKLIRNLSSLGVRATLERIQSSGATTAEEPRLNIEPELVEPKPQAEPRTEAENEAENEADVESAGSEAIESPPVAPEIIGESHAPAAFPKTERPKASIIIPVYNKWSYTAACLTSLLEVKGKYSFEVIIVDDQSSDETAHHLAGIEGVLHLRNEKNLGFVGSCNRGARHARGEYLVMLNNDTRVMEGWLDELIDTFEREPEAGLVGSRLVYPDGRLQESGGIIFNDGSGWNYGRDQDAENPKYHFLREVDYVSGACIALKTDYFHQLGAFDERYAPAYYEDTDLAFRVRESGLKVFIQPLSVVIHYEGVTSGTDTSSGTKRYQLINQKKFVERWQEALKHQPAPVADPNNGAEVLHASQHRIKGRFLFIDATTPEPDKDSGSVRLTNLMQCVRELGYGVTFFADNRAYAGCYTNDLQKSGIEVLYNSWLDSLNTFFRARGSEFDYIFISRHYIAINYISLIKRYCPTAKFIFDTVDLHYLREQRLAELKKSHSLRHTARQTRRSELRVIKAADATVVVSTVEKTVLNTDAPDEKVHILSNIHQVPGRDNDFAHRKDIFFVGGYQHPPNIDAAVWFVNDIWPLIHQQLPELRFHLIGSKAPEQVRALHGNGVVFHGFVESIQPFLSDCRLAVAPLRYGAGVKGKVNMSMAHGQPVVATPAAVEGMHAEHEKELLVAQDAQSFADEVVRLYQDEALWNRLSDASVRNVETHFSMAAARDSLTALFDSLKD